ncbi:protein mono-ADP-ribosyltransferase PARP14-like isoform X2 [Eublepharis macularius]|uniref:Poly [ADP-ribose] polymerase n=1 Tax=Eublepharis macularius TaxID=481883 RepID=A0AA97IVH8_EUBMA|nr:protein mono-ADP-ribosyltransferase PARP14-like isoform X2 [Eublepharis macularius]
MAGTEAFLFPLLVEGDWGSSLNVRVKNKLLRYFQSPKRSGGGECTIHAGLRPREQVIVRFAEDEVRQRVLSMETHELDLPGKEKLKLTVSVPVVVMDDSESQQETCPNQESIQTSHTQESMRQQETNVKAVDSDQQARAEPGVPASQPETNISAMTVSREDQESNTTNVFEEKGSPESEIRKKQEFCVEIVTTAEEEIEEEIMELYFENKKWSGGGPIKSCIKDGQRFIVTFEKEEDAREVLQRKNHSIKKIALHVQECLSETTQPHWLTSLVVLENIQEIVDQCILILLVENVSGLSEEDHDFSVEMIPEKNIAVISLIKPTDVDNFIKAFNEHRRVKQLNMSARSLEVTKSILVENIPSDITSDFIVVYFESETHGGGPVSEANYLSKENSAIVTFQYSKDVGTVLAQKHYFNRLPVLVHPYYIPLGTALYGKVRPQPKMPEPVRISLDPYHWRFLQWNRHLLQEISNEMANCFCEIEWPTGHCAHMEVKICPSRALFKQKRFLARTWSEDASCQFAQILSKQKTLKCQVTAEVWEAIRNSVVKDDILIIPDIPEGIVVLVGAVEDVDHAEEEMKVLIGNAVKKIERERQAIEVIITVVAAKYTILKNAGLEERISMEYPDLKISYDASKECIILFGVPTEAFKLKSDILERISSMAQKPINVHAYILIFLQHVDNESLSQLLFWAKKINAFYELQEESVLLTGISPNDLLQAEEEMRKHLSYKCIELEDNSVLQKREWRELTDSLYKAHNCSGEAIIINELEDQIVIAGHFREVAFAAQKLSDFVDTNTYVHKTIRTNSEAVTMYVEKEKHCIWHCLVQHGVKIDFGTQESHRLISLDGPRVEVLKGLDLMQKLLSSLCATRMIVDKPGARALFKEQEHLYITGAKQFNCLIRLQEDGEEPEKDNDNGNAHEGHGNLCCEVKMRNGIVVAVRKADLTHYPADVVVNASNEDLKHIGGLADALLKEAGPELQRECDELVRKFGRLKPGCAVISGAGNLPCKQVIHAVGPRWKSSEKEKCVRLLKKAVRESLWLAETYNHRSIAIPAISSGIFGFPLRECALSIVTAIKESLEESAGTGCLKQIDLVDIKEDTIQVVTDALNEVFRDGSSPLKGRSSPSNSETGNYHRERRLEHQGITTAEGLMIILHQKGIEDATTDVIVNSVASDLKLDKGPLSRALLGRAGPGLQGELITQGQGRSIKEGCVLKTKGYALGCSHVLHAVLPGWVQGQKSEDKNLGKIIEECLTITEQHSLTSITIPAVGTGNLGFPKPLVAKLMFDEVFQFSQKKNPMSLQEVHFVLHPSDTDSIKAFTDELNSRLHVDHSGTPGAMPLLEDSQASSEHISAPTAGVHKMQIGSVTLQVACGDITQEATDVIVNISNTTFNLKNALQPHNNLICTKGGNLRCKNIIHLVPQNDIKAQVSKTLMECEQRQFTSVAFPAIGTGKAARDPAAVADDMIDAIVQYTGKTSAPVVKTIKIIIFQPHLENVFYTSMQKIEGAASKPDVKSYKSIFSKVAEFFGFSKPATETKPALLLENTVKPVIFQICGDSQKDVEKTESWIRDLILKHQNETTVSDEWISSFGEREYEKLRELQTKLHVVIKPENVTSSPSLRIFGLTRDVLSASLEIQQVIKRVRKAQEEQSKADLLSNLVEWRYEDNGHYKTFDNLTNMHIECALQNNSMHEVTIMDKHYRVDPAKQWAIGDQGRRINIRRISKTEDKSPIALPEEWVDMQQKRVIAVELNPGMQEYQDVQQMFNKTCQSFTIEKIERIQNPYYWQAYQIKKQEMDAKNGTTNNEKRLFHGTASSSLTLINNSGFNRSYAGIHAASYGNGTYFAVKASYSAQDIYSKPDANGKKYMYLARVLVGEYCVGSAGLVVPKAKSGTDPTNLFDSVTDNMRHPSMFVIFNDIQAYPEYLITFK